MSAPQAITGSFRSPLRELSELLGVEVVDVERVRVIVGGRPQPDPNAWRLAISGREWDENPVLTRDFRKEWSLNWRARILGRSPDLPLLTKEDGRKALRLMHEVIESKPEHDTTTTITTERNHR